MTIKYKNIGLIKKNYKQLQYSLPSAICAKIQVYLQSKQILKRVYSVIQNPASEHLMNTTKAVLKQ